MHPRIVMLALASVVTDLLCLAAVAFLLLQNNPWLDSVGIARFALVVTLVSIGLVPLMYTREREAIASRLGRAPERAARSLPAWAGVDRSVPVG